jgi:hypothetical protein
MRELHGGGGRHNLTVAPNLWAGVGLVRGGAAPQTISPFAPSRDRDVLAAELGGDISRLEIDLAEHDNSKKRPLAIMVDRQGPSGVPDDPPSSGLLCLRA